MGLGSGRVGPPAVHLVAAEIEGHISLYDPETGRVHVFNGTATDAWLLSDGHHTAEQIVALLAKAYGVEADQIRDPVLRTLEGFYERQLLRDASST